MSNAAELGFLPGKLGKGSGRVDDRVTNFKSSAPAGQAGKGRKSRQVVTVIEFLAQKTPHQKIQISAKLLFVAPQDPLAPKIRSMCCQ